MSLGTHTTTLSITDLSGAAIAAHPLPREWSKATWARALSETSRATATLVTSRAALHDLIEPWNHIATMHRDGDLVWSGPIMLSTSRADTLTLECADPTVLFSRRIIEYEMSWANHDITRIAADVIRAAVAPDDPYGASVGVVVTPYGTARYVTYHVTPGTKLVSEVLKDLVDMGLEWTYSAGRLYLGAAMRTTVTAPIAEAHLAAPLGISKDGSDMVTRQRILGRGCAATYEDTSTPVRLDSIESVDAITNTGACFDEARRRVKSRSVAPYRIVPGSSQLLPSAPVSMRELIPGIGVPIAVSRAAATVDTVLRLTGTSTDAATDTTEITLDTMPQELEPQEFASPSIGDTKSDTIPETGSGGL